MNESWRWSGVLGAAALLAGVSASNGALVGITPIAVGSNGYNPLGAFDDQPASLDFTYDATKQIYINEGGGKGAGVPSYTSDRSAWFDFGEDWASIRIHEVWVSYNDWAGGTIQSSLNNDGVAGYPRLWWDDDTDNDHTDAGAVASALTFYNSVPRNTGEFQWVLDSDFSGSPYTPQGRYLLVGTTDVSPVAAGRAMEWVFIGEVIPEPSTISLLAMGGLIALRRRR